MANELLTELLKLTALVERTQPKRVLLRMKLREHDEGRHNGYTVYQVKQTRVKAHIRKAFRAVRLHKR